MFKLLLQQQHDFSGQFSSSKATRTVGVGGSQHLLFRVAKNLLRLPRTRMETVRLQGKKKKIWLQEKQLETSPGLRRKHLVLSQVF